MLILLCAYNSCVYNSGTVHWFLMLHYTLKVIMYLKKKKCLYMSWKFNSVRYKWRMVGYRSYNSYILQRFTLITTVCL